eukprot:RCo048613
MTEGTGSTPSPRPPWEKVLYRRQPYEDNYVDKKRFLEQMRENANVEVFEYWSCVRETAVITQQLCLVIVFGVLFKHLYDGTLSLRFLVGLDALLAAVAAGAWPLLDPTLTAESAGNAARSAVAFLVLLLLFSPVMHTLTSSYSSDTIWALSSTLLVLHVVFTDFQYINGCTDTHNGAVSINAATFSAVLLASRLPSPTHTFALVALAIVLFGLLPVLRHDLKRFSMEGYVSLTWLLFGTGVASLAHVHAALAVGFSAVILSTTFLLPRVLIGRQLSQKRQIHGPWDEATPPATKSSLQWRNAS